MDMLQYKTCRFLLDEVKECLEEAHIYSDGYNIDPRVRLEVRVEGVFDLERGKDQRGCTIRAGKKDSPRIDEIDLICFLVSYEDNRKNERIEYLYELRITDGLHHSWFKKGEKKDYHSWKEAVSEMIVQLKMFLMNEGFDENGGGAFSYINIYTLEAHFPI